MSDVNYNVQNLETRLNNVESTLSIVLSMLETQSSAKTEKLITCKELCAMLGVTYPTIWHWMKLGKLKYRRISRRIYFDPVEIKEMMSVNVNPERK